MMKGLLIFALIFNGLVAAGAASSGTEEELRAVEGFIGNFSKGILHTLHNEELTEEEKLAHLEEIFEPHFDFPLMAKFALGRKSWKRLTEEEKQEYTTLFQELITHQYIASLLSFKITELHVKQIKISKKKTKYIVRVNTDIHQETGQSLQIKWVLQGGPDIQDLKCFDVSIDGISLLINLQQELKSLLRREKNNIANFLRIFADKVEKGL